MSITFTPTGRWTGHNQLWLHPGAEVERSDATIEVAERELSYHWSFQGEPKVGLIRLGGTGDRVELAWQDSFHAAEGIALVGHATDDQLIATGSYPDDQGGPDWGWRIEISRSGPCRVRMFNITPDGQEALAVDLQA